MGSLNCHCISSRAEAGPILDDALRNESRKGAYASTLPDLDTYSTTDYRCIDPLVSTALKVYLCRKRGTHLGILQKLERKLGVKLGDEVVRQYLTVGPYFGRLIDSNEEVVKLPNGSVYFGESSDKEQFHGQGCLVSSEGVLTEGNWSKGLLQGPGRMIYPNGDFYEVETR